MGALNPTLASRDRQIAFLLLLALVPGLMAWRLAASWLSSAGLFIDEAQYWDWSRDLAWGYFSKPPVLAVLIRWSTALAGDGLAGVRWLVVLLWTLTPVILWRLVWEMTRDRCPDLSIRDRLLAGAWAAVLSSAMLVFAFIGQVATTDGPLLFFWALLMWLFWRLQREGTPWWAWAIWGALLALAVLSKYTAVVALASAVWLVLRQRDPRLRLGLSIAVLVCALLLMPHVMWNQTHGWPTLRHTAELLTASGSDQRLGPAQSLGLYLISQCVVVGPVLIVLTAFWALRGAGRPRQPASPSHSALFSKPSLLLWAWTWSWPIWLIGGLQALSGKAQMNWPAPAVLGLSVFLGLWRSGMARSDWRGPWVVLLLGAAMGGTISLGGDWRNHFGVQGTGPRWDLWSRAKGWDTALQAMTPYIAAFPDARIVASERALIAHASYAWRKQGWRPEALPADPVPAHHYELFHAFEPQTALEQGVPVLWVTTESLPAQPAQLRSFSSPQKIYSHPAPSRVIHLWKLDPP